jgi:hypothetical protein
MLNMMWAIRIVTRPRVKAAVTNRDSRDAPRTTSGVAMGRKMNMFVDPRPRNRYRVRARAIMVPRVVAAAVLMAAMISEFLMARVSSGMLNRSPQCSRVKPCQVKLNRPRMSLNPNRIITAMGKNRYTRTIAVYTGRTQARRLTRSAPRSPGSGRTG